MDIYDLFDVIDSIYEYNITSPHQIAHELGFSTIKLTNILNIFVQNGIIAITDYSRFFEPVFCLKLAINISYLSH